MYMPQRAIPSPPRRHHHLHGGGGDRNAEVRAQAVAALAAASADYAGLTIDFEGLKGIP